MSQDANRATALHLLESGAEHGVGAEGLSEDSGAGIASQERRA
jgi:hypothetical protein